MRDNIIIITNRINDNGFHRYFQGKLNYQIVGSRFAFAVTTMPFIS